METIDELKEMLNKRIDKNFKKADDILTRAYGWPLLDTLRLEICYSIFVGASQAAMTLCNHLLESSLKQFLINSGQVAYHVTEGNEIEEHFKEMNRLYAHLDLQDTINRCKSKGIILKEEAKELQKYREIYRNAFGHANPDKTFAGRKKTIGLINFVDGEKLKIHEANISYWPFLQGTIQKNICDAEVEGYFRYIDMIIRKGMPKIFDMEPKRKTE